MSAFTTKDGTQIYYKDCRAEQPVVFNHGWPLSADAFEDQMFYLASRGYRCIAHDRRGHGRSSQPWTGNDMDTYADDLAELVRHLNLKKRREKIMSGLIPTARKRSPIEQSLWEQPPGYHAEREGPSTHPFDQRPAATGPERVDAATAKVISFGLFRVMPAQRLLLHADKAIPLGSRALDILIALVTRPGELMGKDELMARVWPDTFVEPANLTVHVAALRRALGDGRDGNRFIVNIPGRGYQFVAAVTATLDF